MTFPQGGRFGHPVTATGVISSRSVLLLMYEFSEALLKLISTVLVFTVIVLAAERFGKFSSRWRLPLITGYLFAGCLAGPDILKILDRPEVEQLGFVNQIALAIIALAAGNELVFKEIRSQFRSIAWVTVGLVIATFGLGAMAMYVLSGWLPVMKDLGVPVRLAIALLTGVILVARSPSSAIAIVNELRAKGPLTSTILGVTVIMDGVVIALFAVNSEIAHSITASDFHLDFSFIGLLLLKFALSIICGYGLGKLLSAYMRWHLPHSLKFVLVLVTGFAVFELTEPGDGLLLSEEDVLVSTTGHLAEQAWTVLPAYQYTRIPTRLSGLITIADGGTTVTGSEYCSFTTQLKVGEEFQTEDVSIIAEDSGGDVVLETDERLEHEDITLGDADAFVLDTVENIRLQDWRWLISQENDVIAAHSAHANVTGVYLERTMSLDAQDDSWVSVGESSYGTNIGSGGNEATAWDTNDESFWIPTHESSDGIGITRVVSGSDDGTIRVESLEWENINMIWEDFSKQLIIEPQAFIVGSITNDASMTVTRKHLGGVTEAEYRL